VGALRNLGGIENDARGGNDAAGIFPRKSQDLAQQIGALRRPPSRKPICKNM
jgi:hypothetical protein